MEFKGTKGEWEIMMDDDEIKVIQSSSLENGSGWRSYVAICEEVQCIEDANLIAAAPDLLEALQALFEAWSKGGAKDISNAEKMATAAISKALGEE
ncbi:hypothetical protein C7387_4328 [Yokenella regensburgei]|uniref:Uncharacterized protein n=1 Tax=Yokenella regensburgei TaxID=158877 RepID=A0ABX9RTU9_9ENTR|nr:hypothetical protein [Yokenella regensburgei]RKR53188.1 hypothetical protein C7387_4328 [Yokenella regensburgei]VFS16115.1 Uncharacterised protein [Yokenella regensburgei]